MLSLCFFFTNPSQTQKQKDEVAVERLGSVRKPGLFALAELYKPARMITLVEN